MPAIARTIAGSLRVLSGSSPVGSSPRERAVAVPETDAPSAGLWRRVLAARLKDLGGRRQAGWAPSPTLLRQVCHHFGQRGGGVPGRLAELGESLP